LEGEVATAGVYQAQPGETLRSLVRRVGGISRDAFLYGAIFTRESVRAEQQRRLDDFVTQSERDVEAAATRGTRSVVNSDDAIALNTSLEAQRRLVDKLKGVRSTGRVVLDIKPGESDPNSLPELVLEDGDTLFVPYRASTVNVIGAVYNDNAFLFENDRHVSHYLRRAGGTTRNGDKGNVLVIRANGNIERAPQSMSWFTSGDRRVLPGDTIVVPQNIVAIGLLRGLRDWSQIFAQFAIGVAGLRAITRD
jgi:polysaccharide biosynthesis/export protein